MLRPADDPGQRGHRQGTSVSDESPSSPLSSALRLRPPLLRDWPVPVRLVLAALVPISFGFLCGALLGSSGVVFLVLQVIGAAGGFFARLGDDPLRGRGLGGGLVRGGVGVV